MSDSVASSSSPNIGKHKIFLGYAPGVGKTFAMLDEAHRRKKRGQDIVIGLIETHGRAATEEMIGDLEVLPATQKGRLETLDMDAILARRPDAVLVDNLAASDGQNARWVDADKLLDAGISVLSTLDVRHIESLNDTVRDIIGTPPEETVPDHVLREAEEVEMVDLTPRALLNRIARGDVTLDDGTLATTDTGWINEGTLSALRELALREVAGRIDEDVAEYRKNARIQKPWATTDKVMICLSPSRSSLRLVRKGWRVSQRLHAEAVVVFVEQRAAGEATRKFIRDDFALAERLGIPTVTLHGDPAEEIVRYVRENNITQLVIGHSSRSRVQAVIKGSIVSDLIRELPTVDILVTALDAAPAAEH